jgi:hypothetical protein
MTPVLDLCKNSALKFHEDVMEALKSKRKHIDSLRVRVVAFGDIYVDGSSWIKQSDFYSMPKDKDGFSDFLSTLKAEGGGDEPENGLEALGYAINSDWTDAGTRRRHVIVLYTDANAHPIEKHTDHGDVDYPQDLPKTFEALSGLWNLSDKAKMSARRIVLFAPDAYPWTDIALNWQCSIHHTSEASNGLAEIDYHTILDTIANSV